MMKSMRVNRWKFLGLLVSIVGFVACAHEGGDEIVVSDAVEESGIHDLNRTRHDLDMAKPRDNSLNYPPLRH